MQMLLTIMSKQFAFMLKRRNKSFFQKESIFILDDHADQEFLFLLSGAVILFTYHIHRDPEYSEMDSWFKELREFNETWQLIVK